MYKIGSMPHSIPIGYTGETNFRNIEIDMTAWLDKMPDGVPSIVHIRPGESKADAYVAVTEFDRETGILSWTITAADIGTLEGEGEMQVWLEETENDTISKRGKSVKVTTKVIEAANDPDETVPSTQEAFLEQVTSLKTQTVTAAAAAEAAQAAAEDAVEKYPYIDSTTGNWMLWDAINEVWTDSGVHAQGPAGPAGGPKGDKGDKGDPGDPGDPTELLDDTAGEGETEKTWSADKLVETTGQLLDTIQGVSVTPEMFGAKGDGITDDSQAVQDAIDAGYNIKLDDNKTYYLASAVTIDHDVHIIGGENTKIITKTPTGGTVNNAIVVNGTLKKTTTMTGDYSTVGTSDNSGNRFTLADMADIEIGDILVVVAEDQYYSYARQSYYLGATLLVSDVYDGHIYTSNSMPWNINNTENVSVKIYSAPEVIIENIKFESDQNSRGSYRYFIYLSFCKNSIVRNCSMTNMDSGITLYRCVNSLVENVTVSKSKAENNLPGDGYGIYLQSCSNTTIRRVLAICSQGCLDLGGTTPNIDTFVKECNLSSECRPVGIDMHENSYNIVLEDCTFGGVSLYGTATVNRCRFIKNNRTPTMGNSIVFRGSHNPEWAKLKVTNCVFDNEMLIQILEPVPQNPIQAFDNIFGSIVIKDCEGGGLYYMPTTSQTILSNTIYELIIKSWKNCYRILRNGAIKHLVIEDSTFTHYLWLNDNNNAHGIYTDGIEQFDFSSKVPMMKRLTVDKDTYSEIYTMDKNAPVTLSSQNENAKFIICGKNIVSNNVDDYVVGQVSGSVGGNLSRTKASFSNPPEISFDENDNLIYTQKNNASSACVYPFYMAYARERGTISISAILKNVGETNAAGFYPYIAVVDRKTGKVEYRGNGTYKAATAEGVEIKHAYVTNGDTIYVCYFYCSDAVNNSVSKFENMKVLFKPTFNTSVETEDAFIANRRTGDGVLASIEGVNNIMSSELLFHVNFKGDLL